MRPSSSTVAAAVLVLAAAAAAVLASGGTVGAAARPVVGHGGGDRAAVFVAVELATGTDSSAQPSNCTYGHNSGGVCPPTPPAPGAGH